MLLRKLFIYWVWTIVNKQRKGHKYFIFYKKTKKNAIAAHFKNTKNEKIQ